MMKYRRFVQVSSPAPEEVEQPIIKQPFLTSEQIWKHKEALIKIEKFEKILYASEERRKEIIKKITKRKNKILKALEEHNNECDRRIEECNKQISAAKYLADTRIIEVEEFLKIYHEIKSVQMELKYAYHDLYDYDLYNYEDSEDPNRWG